MALKRSDSMFAAAEDEEEGDDVGDDELAILLSEFLSLPKTVSKHPQTGWA